MEKEFPTEKKVEFLYPHKLQALLKPQRSTKIDKGKIMMPLSNCSNPSDLKSIYQGPSSLPCKSNPTSALYSKFWMKKSQNMLVWLSKMVLAQHFCRWYQGWQEAQQCQVAKPVDCLHGLIGPNGLLLLVSHLLQSQFQFYGWGWEK
jgi:hypothetical protein